ncbi:hypothetical protein ACU4GD_24685 [Cupriavidus basilensis]
MSMALATAGLALAPALRARGQRCRADRRRHLVRHLRNPSRRS